MLRELRDHLEPRDWARPWEDPPGFFFPNCTCCGSSGLCCKSLMTVGNTLHCTIVSSCAVINGNTWTLTITSVTGISWQASGSLVLGGNTFTVTVTCNIAGATYTAAINLTCSGSGTPILSGKTLSVTSCSPFQMTGGPHGGAGPICTCVFGDTYTPTVTV